MSSHPSTESRTAPVVSEEMAKLVDEAVREFGYNGMNSKTALLRAIETLEAERQWWIAEARACLVALCREDTYVIERVTRRVIIMREEEGRMKPGDELHTEFLKAVEARGSRSPSGATPS